MVKVCLVNLGSSVLFQVLEDDDGPKPLGPTTSMETKKRVPLTTISTSSGTTDDRDLKGCRRVSLITLSSAPESTNK